MVGSDTSNFQLVLGLPSEKGMCRQIIWRNTAAPATVNGKGSAIATGCMSGKAAQTKGSIAVEIRKPGDLPAKREETGRGAPVSGLGLRFSGPSRHQTHVP